MLVECNRFLGILQDPSVLFYEPSIPTRRASTSRSPPALTPPDERLRRDWGVDMEADAGADMSVASQPGSTRQSRRSSLSRKRRCAVYNTRLFTPLQNSVLLFVVSLEAGSLHWLSVVTDGVDGALVVSAIVGDNSRQFCSPPVRRTVRVDSTRLCSLRVSTAGESVRRGAGGCFDA